MLNRWGVFLFFVFFKEVFVLKTSVKSQIEVPRKTNCDGLENRLGSWLGEGTGKRSFAPRPARENPIRNHADEQTGQKQEVVSEHGAAVSGTTGCSGRARQERFGWKTVELLWKGPGAMQPTLRPSG